MLRFDSFDLSGKVFFAISFATQLHTINHQDTFEYIMQLSNHSALVGKSSMHYQWVLRLLLLVVAPITVKLMLNCP